MDKVIIKDSGAASGGMVYCLGFIGAIIYFFQNADTFVQFVLGFLKAIVWPAYVVYKALEFFAIK